MWEVFALDVPLRDYAGRAKTNLPTSRPSRHGTYTDKILQAFPGRHSGFKLLCSAGQRCILV